MPRDGMSDAVCEDYDDCNDDLECIDSRCEIRIGFDGGEGLEECGLDGSLVSQEQIAVRLTSASWSVPAAQIGDVNLSTRNCIINLLQ